MPIMLLFKSIGGTWVFIESAEKFVIFL